MKKGWARKALGDLLEIQNGFAFDSKRFSTSRGTPLIRIRDLKNGMTTETNYVGDYDERFVVSAGDLLIGMDGEFRCYEWAGGNALLNQRVCRLQNFHSTLEPRFVLYGVNSYLKEIEDETAFTTVKHLSAKRILGIEFPVPPLREQRRIVAILDEAFEGIAAAKAKAEQNLRNAREIFAAELQRKCGTVKDGWRETTVGQAVDEGIIAKPFDGNHGEIHPKRTDYTPKGVPFVMACDLRNGEVDTMNCTFISPRTAEGLRVGRARSGDVLLSHKGTIGRTAVLATSDDYVMLTPQVTSYRILDNARLLNRFLYYYFQSRFFQQVLVAAAADGSTRAYVGITKQRSLPIRLPPISEQKGIVASLAKIEVEVSRLEQALVKKPPALDELKASLLHQAFTGAL